MTQLLLGLGGQPAYMIPFYMLQILMAWFYLRSIIRQ